MLNREEVLKDIPNRIGSDIKIQFRPILLSTELEAGNILDLCQIGFYVVRCVFNTEHQEASKYDLTLLKFGQNSAIFLKETSNQA